MVVKTYMAIPGVNYTESFSPVMTDSTVRIIIGIYLHKKDKSQDYWILWIGDQFVYCVPGRDG